MRRLNAPPFTITPLPLIRFKRWDAAANTGFTAHRHYSQAGNSAEPETK